ncbi:MAG: methylamine utilization protein, partial [Nitrospinae bacterium]|nr:methylamine utilization protein [Nitrospinota bacterium]
MRHIKRTLFVGLLVLATMGGAGAAFADEIVATVNNAKSGEPVGGAVVFAMPRGGAPSLTVRSAKVDQVNKEFVPHVTVVPLNTPVSFPNSDNISHHVYSLSETKRFELPLYSGTPSRPVLFDTPGPVALGCNIHDWMSAYIYVTPTPYYAFTDAKG